nr:NADH-quinone oxidoreductase subunit L [Kofleriaceae bacterium]
MDVLTPDDYSAGLHFLGLPLLAWIPLLPLLGALINLTLGRKLSRTTVHVIAVAAVAAAAGIAFYVVFGPMFDLYKHDYGGVGISQSPFVWIKIGGFTAEMRFRLDTLSAVMILIVTFIGTLIHIYSTGYMAHDPRFAAFFGYLNLFTGAMLILVLGANLPVMFIGWEGVGLCSFLLIGFWFENEDFATAGRKAFVVNRIGDFCFLLGMFLLYWATKDLAGSKDASLDFFLLKSAPAQQTYMQSFWGGERLAAAAGIFLFIGACGKSAQLPLYVWLPDAMAGPTPVSALIHAATMVTAGVYMVCRMSFLFATSTTALIVVSTVGLLTAMVAAFMALAQQDLKKVLAYSTVSQLGFMFVAAGTGNWTAAIFHLGTHAFFKACLFLGAGSVMHGMEHGGSHTPGDIMTMGGLRKHMPITRVTFMISCLAIAGIFPFSGFFSKDEILGGAFHIHPPGWPVWYGKILWGGLLVAALGTAFYMWRLYFLVFGGEERSEPAKKAHESPLSMTLPLVVLATFATIIGFIGFPHFKSFETPAPMHALASWLEPSVAHEWYEGAGKPAEPIGEASLAEVKACDNRNAKDVCALPGGEGEGVCDVAEPGAKPACSEPGDTGLIGLLILALGIGGLGIGLAWSMYGAGRGGPSRTVQELTEGPLHDVYEASKHKLWVDEIYDAVFVKPFRALARGLFEIVDRFVIDTVAVTGVAFVIGLFGRMSRWFQNGQVQRYLVGLVVGAAAVFLVTDCHTKPTFSYERQPGGTIHLHAQVAGLMRATSVVKWDLDDDGQPDPGVTGIDLVKRADEVAGEVTMWIDDPVDGKTDKVTRTIDLSEDN